MKSCSRWMRVLAIIALFVMYFVVITNCVISLTEIAESREELQESIEEHEEESHSKYKDCSTCENYEEREKSLDRNVISVGASSIGSLVLYSVFCGIMYGVGAIISIMSGTKESEKPRVPVCPNCGKTQRKGSKFCYVCGTAVES